MEKTKTPTKTRPMGGNQIYKKRVDRQEETKQWRLNRALNAAKIKHDDKKQAKIKKQLQKSFKRQEYYHTPGDAKNKDTIANFQIRRAMPEIEKAEREGRLVPRKTRKRTTSAGRKRRKKTKKKRHIITRKNKRKPRRRTKKRKGGMPKVKPSAAENKRIKELKQSAFSPMGNKFQKKSSSLSSKLKKRARSGLKKVETRASLPAGKMFASASLDKQMANLDLGSQQQTQQKTSESKQ